jgi:hypothetical protein
MDSIEKCKEVLKNLVQQIEVLKEVNDTDGLKNLEGDVRELHEKVRVLQEENQRLISRQNSESWEWVASEALGAMENLETQSLLAERVPSFSASDEADIDPPIIGGLPLEPESEDWASTTSTERSVRNEFSRKTWHEWLMSFHPSLFTVFSGIFQGLVGTSERA